VTFPLVPRGRVVGLSFGTMRSLRRGTGSDVAGSRPYRSGDDVHAIDWAASARLSSARETDEFVVRELYAEEAPRVVVVSDRRPAMSFFSPPLPWLDKGEAMRQAGELIRSSVALVGGFVGSIEYERGEPRWEPPRAARPGTERSSPAAAAAQDDTPARALAYLGEHRRSVPAGTFVFVLSDFLPAPPPDEAWLAALEHRWDVVPVVIQDPVWEQSFPDTSGIAVRLRDPASGRVAPARLTAREAAARREANEERLRSLVDGLRALGIEPIVVSSSDAIDVLVSFLAWAELRRTRRGS
jgi:uncharacterized protein (DUF58 family)